jgi:hypothetical protein
MPTLALNTVEENPRLLLCGINIFIGFTKDKVASHFVAIEFFIVGICDRCHRLTPIRFFWDANEYFVGYSLLHQPHCAGDPGFFA